MKKLLLKNALLCGLLTAVASCSGCVTPSQAYWDAKVKELCEKDGGITVYEKIRLRTEELMELSDYFGAIRAPVEKYIKPYDVLFSERSVTVLNKENPIFKKMETRIFRRSDRKLLGSEITYGRMGLDVQDGYGHSSSYGCGDIDGFLTNINKYIYEVVGE